MYLHLERNSRAFFTAPSSVVSILITPCILSCIAMRGQVRALIPIDNLLCRQIISLDGRDISLSRSHVLNCQYVPSSAQETTPSYPRRDNRPGEDGDTGRSSICLLKYALITFSVQSCSQGICRVLCMRLSLYTAEENILNKSSEKRGGEGCVSLCGNVRNASKQKRSSRTSRPVESLLKSIRKKQQQGYGEMRLVLAFPPTSLPFFAPRIVQIVVS